MNRTAVVAMVLAMGAGMARAEVSREQIEGAIENGVKFLVSTQADDGHWDFKTSSPAIPNGEHLNPGNTALALLALQHSGSRSPEAQTAIRKGLTYLTQQPPNPRTYTAGLVEQVFYMDSAGKYPKYVSAYAWMLCQGQKASGSQLGSWTYPLPTGIPGAGGNNPAVLPDIWQNRSDNSNSQFGILGLVYAEKCGFQVPRVVWERGMTYYAGSQHTDGGWDYQSDAYRTAEKLQGQDATSKTGMTFAGTVSTYLCEEALADKKHSQCKTPTPNPVFDGGMKWIATNWRKSISQYDWYACERLGLLTGYSEFGGHDWFQEGAPESMAAIGKEEGYHGATATTSFAVLFLSRGRNPIIINKLKREGDWNLHRFDISNLIEHISGPWQIPCQWRIVTLDAKMEMLLKTPILWISGHGALKFTAEEKAKLKEYVEKGGTILGEDCCSKKAFDDSFKALLKELWPDNTLADLPKTHAIYTSFRKLENPPELMGMALEKGQGRLGVLYIPHGISCKWEVGGADGKRSLDAGACIYLYVEKIGKKMKTEPAATETPAAETPAAKTEN